MSDGRIGISVMDYPEKIGLDWGTIGRAMSRENRDRSIEIIKQHPTIGKYEFIEALGIDYDEEGILMHDFLCRRRLMPYHIAEAMDEEHYDKTLEIMQTQPDIDREAFLKLMQFTGKYKEEFTH